MGPARITEFPGPGLRTLVATGEGKGLFEGFYGREALLFGLGRGAVWAAARALGLGPGSRVVVPPYHCGVEIEPLVRAGASVDYYRLRPDMTIDLADFAAKATGADAALIIHYYGFPQPVEEISDICRTRDAALIEDCAHALFSKPGGRTLGTFGDLSVFSQRKTLPLTDGGALVVNDPGLTPEPPGHAPARSAVSRSMVSKMLKPFDGNPLVSALRSVRRAGAEGRGNGNGEDTPEGLEFEESMGEMSISGISRRIMNAARPESVTRERRGNYTRLLSALASPLAEPCFPDLPEGVCPLFLPVRVPAGKRSVIRDEMRRQGVETFVFGMFPHPTLPAGGYATAREMSDTIMCLPIHQGLTPDEIGFVAETFNTVRP